MGMFYNTKNQSVKNNLLGLALVACQTLVLQTFTPTLKAEKPAAAASVHGIWLKNSGDGLNGFKLYLSGRLHYFQYDVPYNC
jgi:uncharacterized lipoprotein YddW (UPF0748 family)